MNVDLVKTSLDKPLVEHSGLSIESLPASEEGKRDCVYTLGSRKGEDMSVLKARSTGSLARDSTEEERTLLADASCPDSSISAAEHTGKRKEPPKFTGSRFKAVGNVVLAMKRFQASINPTVTFGKPPSSAGGSGSSGGAAAPASLQGGEATSARLGPKDPANVSKLQRMRTSSRNRFATVMQPLADEP